VAVAGGGGNWAKEGGSNINRQSSTAKKVFKGFMTKA
jgi:hypothetical protein